MTFAGNLDAALSYDRWFDQPWGRYALAVESRALLRAAGDVAERKVLDVGCGTGRFTAQLEQRRARVAGLDLDPAMLEVARNRLVCPLVLGDACDLPFADASFDLTLAVTLCEFVGDVDRVFAELARVTRKGGRFVVGSLNPRSLWGLTNRRRFREPPWTDARFLTRAELMHLGQKHGAATLRSVLYAPEGMPALSKLGPVLDALGRLAPGYGAFQVLTVRRPS